MTANCHLTATPPSARNHRYHGALRVAFQVRSFNRNAINQVIGSAARRLRTTRPVAKVARALKEIG